MVSNVLMIDKKNSIQNSILLSLILSLVSYSPQAFAQTSETSSAPNLESLLLPFSSSEAPDSAALSILEIPRSAVALPSASPSQFGLTILESISNSNGDFLGNFGLEIAPYYWFDNTLGFEDYIANKKFGQSILPTLSLSIATTDVEIPEDGVMVDSTRLGIGLRTKLLSGLPSSEINELVTGYKEISNACINEIIERDARFDFEQESPTERVTTTKDCSLATKRDELGREIRDLATDLRGLEIAFAAGGAFDVPGDDWDEVEFSRASASAIVSLRPTVTRKKEASQVNEDSENEIKEPSALQFLGVTRYIYDDFNDNGASILDIGAKALWQIDEPLIVSAEYLHRFADDDDDRLVGIFEYRFNQQYSLFASFGKNFDGENGFSGDGDLVTLFGINLGLGNNFLEIK